MTNMALNKRCIVPFCQNNTVDFPNKIFFMLPLDEVKRHCWLKAAGCDVKSFSMKKNRFRFICEDHFDLEKDAENFIEMRLMNVKPRLRKDVIPHINCMSIQSEREVGLKRKFSDLLDPKINEIDLIESQPGTSKGFKTSAKIPQTGTSFHYSCSVSSSKASLKNEKIIIYKSTSSMDTGSATYEDDEYEPQSSDFTDSEASNEERNFKKYSIEKNPKIFLGLPVLSYYLIKELTNKTEMPTVNILITLKKIKLDDSFAVLGIHFGMTSSNIGKIFRKTLVHLVQSLQELIYWPDVSDIRRELPLPFRDRYGKVVSIIDCLEIEIERPGDPVHQSLTWSQYKHCNTIKYLLSCTPDGMVSFISAGFGGRASDVLIVENCGYLDKLQPGMEVMADRGFKNLAPLLIEKQCHLIRPPSVSNSTPSSRQEVLESKRIAALRIHVERVIGRLREFKMLLPHSCIDNHHIQLLDFIIVTACGIINVQDILMKGSVSLMMRIYTRFHQNEQTSQIFGLDVKCCISERKRWKYLKVGSISFSYTSRTKFEKYF